MTLRSEATARVSMVRTSVARVLLSTRTFHRGWVIQMISAAGNDSRSAATAGKVCTMSPREPSRRTRKRGSDMRGLANGIEEVARRVIFRIANDGDADAEACGGGALGYGFDRVVGAFGMDVGTQKIQQGLDVRFAEEHDVVDGTECGHQIGTRGFRQDRPARAFQV